MENRRYLVPAVLHAGGCEGMSVVEISGGSYRITPFERETANTCYVASPMALLREDAVDEYLIEDIERITTHFDIKTALKKLDDLFRSSGLYSSCRATGVVLACDCYLL